MKVMCYIERDPETGLFVGIVPSIPGAHTQAENLEELRENLQEVVELCLSQLNEVDRESLSEFVAIEQLEVIV